MLQFSNSKLKVALQFFNKIFTVLIILATITTGAINLLSLNNNIKAKAQTTDIVGLETTKTDINQVEFDNSTSYKFGTRINFIVNPADVKTEICGDSIVFGSGNFDAKFDNNSGATIIKTLSSKCGNSTTKQNWLKLLWDNGLVGWVLSPNQSVVNLESNSFNPINFLAPISVSAQEVPSPPTQTLTTKKTCKDFTTQIRDLRILNQYPNLGCEHLPVNPNDGFATGNDKLKLQKTIELDISKDGKVTCADFETQVIDTEILTIYPNLDGDSDGVGCESKALVGENPKFALYSEESDLTLPDIVLNQVQLESKIDWSKTGLDLQKALQSDYNYLFQADSDCHTFDLGCQAINSIAGLGKKGLWIFKFLTGVLQGVGQSIVDLLKQVWDLITNATETVSKIVESFQKLINDPSLLLKVFQDELTNILGADTLERANKIGRVIGGLIPDIIVTAVTAGVGAVGLKALQGLNLSQKVLSTTIKVSKFVGKTLQLVSGKFEIVLKSLTYGLFGIAGRQATDLVKTLDNTGFDELVEVVEKVEQKLLIHQTRLLLKGAKLVDSKLVRFSQSTIGKSFSDGSGLVDDLVTKLQNGVVQAESISPLQIVKMKDGIYTSLDNRRLTATAKASSMVNVVERGYDELLEIEITSNLKLMEKYKYPKTFGEFISARIQDQTSAWRKNNPNGSFGLPIIK
jgi:hypothetical protein